MPICPHNILLRHVRVQGFEMGAPERKAGPGLEPYQARPLCNDVLWICFVDFR